MVILLRQSRKRHLRKDQSCQLNYSNLINGSPPRKCSFGPDLVNQLSLLKIDQEPKIPPSFQIEAEYSEVFRCDRYRLSCPITGQGFAGLYYQHEVEALLLRFPRGPVAVAKFMRVAERIVQHGLVAPELLKGASHE